jgi:hypothetical protein
MLVIGTVLLAMTFVGCMSTSKLYSNVRLIQLASSSTSEELDAEMHPPSPAPAEEDEHQGHGFPRVPSPTTEPTRPNESSRPAAASAPIKRVPSIESATQQVLEQLFRAAAAISGNTVASIDDTVELTLTLDPSQTANDLESQLRSSNPDAKITVVETQTSALAWPEIIAPNFDVTPSTAEEQAVTSDGPTTWTWQLKPREGGEFTVLVDLYAIVYVGDKQTKRKYKTLRQPITITVPEVPWYITVRDWALEHWDKVWTLMLLPVVGYIWSRFNKKKRKK